MSNTVKIAQNVVVGYAVGIGIVRAFKPDAGKQFEARVGEIHSRLAPVAAGFIDVLERSDGKPYRAFKEARVFGQQVAQQRAAEQRAAERQAAERQTSEPELTF